MMNTTKFYTGVGARKTPMEMLKEMQVIASILAEANFTLRSGGAAGADTAFESGCQKCNGSCNIFLPWRMFQRNKSNLIGSSPEAYQLAAKVHPAWHRCSAVARQFHARNAHQVLGQDLKTPSKFLICWTKDGEHVGGTRTAIVLAIEYDIPVFNLALNQDRKDLAELIMHEAVEFAVKHST